MGMSFPDHPESRSTISAVRHSAAPLIRRTMAVLAVFLCLVGVSTIAHAETADVQTAWRLLDYMAVDYGGAVSGGRIKSVSEYAEMTEFAASVSARLMARHRYRDDQSRRARRGDRCAGDGERIAARRGDRDRPRSRRGHAADEAPR